MGTNYMGQGRLRHSMGQGLCCGLLLAVLVLGSALSGCKDNARLAGGRGVAPAPEPAPLSPTIFITAGNNHTTALKRNLTLWAWGFNGNGRLGDNTTVQRNVPTQEFTAATDWEAVAAGRNHTVALKSGGTLWAWGDNANGQLGGNTIAGKTVPTQEFTAATDWRP